MVDACRALEQCPSTFPRSVRIQIPRIILALYEIRNSRGVGHVGGDVLPNAMDAICVLQMSKWIVAELVRVFHAVSTEEATKSVEALSARELTLVWKVNGIARVLDNNLSMLDKTLVLLFASPLGLHEDSLLKSIEHSNRSVYRRDILRSAHKKRLIEYDEESRITIISPLGSKRIEAKIVA